MFEKSRNIKQEPQDSQSKQDNFAAPANTSTGSGRSAVIGPGIHINGDISGDESLIIEGRVDGKVRLDLHQVEVGQSGRVSADITAKVIKIAGEVRGDVTGSEKVIILRSGNVRGNIVAPRMTLEDGAIFKGSIDMDPGGPVKTSSADPVKKVQTKTDGKATETPKVVASGKSNESKNYSLNGG
ncbi:MAG: polymer-forming cytoskeletal protein [Xanthomonadales bacterium]|nr:polymer-forming cytoskeletal protein [Xanthomonadales bacterium]